MKHKSGKSLMPFLIRWLLRPWTLVVIGLTGCAHGPPELAYPTGLTGRTPINPPPTSAPDVATGMDEPPIPTNPTRTGEPGSGGH
ncbi:MAG: hypothetical protein ABSF50_02950 [Burkholderiaceae bacterium]|jgi:hypothetical protein